MNEENRKSKSTTFPSLSVIYSFEHAWNGVQLHSFPLCLGNAIRKCGFAPFVKEKTRLIIEAEIFTTVAVMRDEGYAPRAVPDVMNPFPALLWPDVALPHLM